MLSVICCLVIKKRCFQWHKKLVDWHGMGYAMIIIFILELRKVFGWLKLVDWWGVNSFITQAPVTTLAFGQFQLTHKFFIFYIVLPKFGPVHQVPWTGASVFNALPKGSTAIAWLSIARGTQAALLLAEHSNHLATTPTIGCSLVGVSEENLQLFFSEKKKLTNVQNAVSGWPRFTGALTRLGKFSYLPLFSVMWPVLHSSVLPEP